MTTTRPIALMFALLAAACTRTPDAQAIRDAIERAAQAAQAHDAPAIVAVLADDFIGNDDLGKDELKSHLRGQFLVTRSVGARIGPVDVEVNGDRATARFDAFVTDSSGRWIPDRAATLHFETGWRRERGRWLCVNAKWPSDPR